ncbi:universal stress protein [Geodermatophilus sp. CPCC 206100]|uniref:universal stress protein n=1 Tax=Geodermatophilus sp. CPCC 206100 TaxID=3020054 RepID=UPI003B00AF26
MTGVVVVGVVPNPRGEAALQHAVVEARRRDARLVVVNSSRGDALVDEEYLQGDRLRQLQADLTAAGVSFEVRQPIGRDVAEELAAAVEETGAELLVIGLRRRSAVGKLLMGSAAQRILLDVDCPVLAVKTPPPEGTG